MGCGKKEAETSSSASEQEGDSAVAAKTMLAERRRSTKYAEANAPQEGMDRSMELHDLGQEPHVAISMEATPVHIADVNLLASLPSSPAQGRSSEEIIPKRKIPGDVVSVRSYLVHDPAAGVDLASTFPSGSRSRASLPDSERNSGSAGSAEHKPASPRVPPFLFPPPRPSLTNPGALAPLHRPERAASTAANFIM